MLNTPRPAPGLTVDGVIVIECVTALLVALAFLWIN